MAIALDRSKIYYYFLKQERDLPKEQQTVFKLKPVSSRTWRDIKGLMSKPETFGDYVHRMVQEGLVGWENFRSADGQLIEFNNSDPKNPDAMLDMLQEGWKNEIAFFLMNHALLGEAEAIKSAARSQSPEA